LAWVEPEGYRAGLALHVENLRNFLEDESNIGKVVCATYAKRPDREMLNVKSVTSEVLKILAPFGAVEQPMWPAAYVPCGPDGRALYYMKEAEIAVLRELMAPLVPKLHERCASGKCLVTGITAARVFGGFPELRQYVMTDGEPAPGHGPCYLPHPSEWHKLHGEEKLGPVYAKLASVLGPEFPDLEAFERQVNAAYRRVRISVGLWVHANIPPDKRDEWRKNIASALGRPETKVKLSTAKKEMYEQRPELRTEVGERTRVLWETDRVGQCRRIADAMARPEVKSKQKDGIATKWADENFSIKRREQMRTRGKDLAADVQRSEASMPDSYHRKKSDAISIGKRKKAAAAEGREVTPDEPKAMRLHVPTRLTTPQRAEVLALLQRRHSVCCIDPTDECVFWAICEDGNLRRGARAVRTLLDKFEVTRAELPPDWQGLHPPSRIPLRSSAASSSSE
jgi:hypothetical protein